MCVWCEAVQFELEYVTHNFLDPPAVHFAELLLCPARLFHAHFVQDLLLYESFCLLKSGHDKLFRSPLSFLRLRTVRSSASLRRPEKTHPDGEWDCERKTRCNGK